MSNNESTCTFVEASEYEDIGSASVAVAYSDYIMMRCGCMGGALRCYPLEHRGAFLPALAICTRCHATWIWGQP